MYKVSGSDCYFFFPPPPSPPSVLPRSCHASAWFRRRWRSTPRMTRTTKLVRAWPKLRRRLAAGGPLSSNTGGATKVRFKKKKCHRGYTGGRLTWGWVCADVNQKKSTVGHVVMWLIICACFFQWSHSCSSKCTRVLVIKLFLRVSPLSFCPLTAEPLPP